MLEPICFLALLQYMSKVVKKLWAFCASCKTHSLRASYCNHNSSKTTRAFCDCNIINICILYFIVFPYVSQLSYSCSRPTTARAASQRRKFKNTNNYYGPNNKSSQLRVPIIKLFFKNSSPRWAWHCSFECKLEWGVYTHHKFQPL